MFSSVNELDWAFYNKIQKSATFVFLNPFYAENLPKCIGIFLFLQNAPYLQITARTFSETMNVHLIWNFDHLLLVDASKTLQMRFWFYFQPNSQTFTSKYTLIDVKVGESGRKIKISKIDSVFF